ncbi:uncharacterized protein KY384_004474 [Bacidia gigantensis]|uniref:uncharacterized protein n=1 Tax=Bacidia gigantensis TaxID=2732470 RepID=UPI001D058287|nr:uncharacterized protein KY384_004474 [Bacidia gigantensis]KAG8531117.1 hypothetical protein KY384_004474 [Bacidia gigantensis]
MAGQPNISSILANLGGQQPNARPIYPPMPQQPQSQPFLPQYPPHPQPQPSYPPPYQVPQPSVMPQPKGSGMINLYDIKPVSSGSVNLESVPAARPSYHAVNPQSGYAPRRSRSRSPLRSSIDHYHSGQDSYRADRWIDPQVARVRDMSPVLRDSSKQRQSPLTGRRISGPGSSSGNDTHTEAVMIDSSSVGLVIGRQGENMRKLEANTRTRIQFAPAAESKGLMRRCTITGSREAIENAINEINRTMEEHDHAANVSSSRAPPPPGRNLEASLNGARNSPAAKEGNTLVIMVPSKTVGLIIGKGGESIKSIQDRSHCHVNIMPEDQNVNGMRPIHLIGTSQQAGIARNIIMDIVHNDSKALPQETAASREGVNAMALGIRGGNEKTTVNILVPSEAVGMIIGKGGESVRDMQDVTSCKINVSQPSGRDVQRDIELIGSRTSIEQAKAAIMEKVRAVKEKNNSRNGGQAPRIDSPHISNIPREVPIPQSQPLLEESEPPGGHEAYAAYGGYQNYVALWYASTQGKQAQQNPSAPSYGAPGPSYS